MESQKINRIKTALVENDKTGKWLAEQVGKNEATVSRWCSNKIQPSPDTLVKGFQNYSTLMLKTQLLAIKHSYGQERNI